ncbi:MAG TPA: 50S ribosomal protein L21 [Candidatus Saccharimonadales bacterium]|nr:50S ribosomal protein L21 [Candidatus Saccharimonadales bacterium]
MIKKAVITSGGKQYLVSEGDQVVIELVKSDNKTVDFEPLMVIDGDKVQVGSPTVNGVKVSTTVIETDKMADKVTSIRYKSKKRVHKVRGHRQHQTHLKVTKIS